MDDLELDSRLIHKMIDGSITDEERANLVQRTKARIEGYKQSGSYFDYMSRWRRFILWLFSREEWGISAEDTQCFVDCCCGEHLSVSDYEIKWCPKCGRGYSTRFRCYRYPKWLRRQVKDE